MMTAASASDGGTTAMDGFGSEAEVVGGPGWADAVPAAASGARPRAGRALTAMGTCAIVVGSGVLLSGLAIELRATHGVAAHAAQAPAGAIAHAAVAHAAPAPHVVPMAPIVAIRRMPPAARAEPPAGTREPAQVRITMGGAEEPIAFDDDGMTAAPDYGTAITTITAVAEPDGYGSQPRALRPAPGVTTYRIPKASGRTPVTDSITAYGKWAVACEARGVAKSCFATTYVTANAATMKVRVGLAAAKDAPSRLVPESSGRRPYAMTVVGPPGLDEASGFSVVAPGTVAFLPLAGGCAPGACEGSAFVGQRDAICSTASEAAGGAILVTSTVGPKAYAWRLPCDGASASLARVRQEMGDGSGQGR